MVRKSLIQEQVAGGISRWSSLVVRKSDVIVLNGKL